MEKFSSIKTKSFLNKRKHSLNTSSNKITSPKYLKSRSSTPITMKESVQEKDLFLRNSLLFLKSLL